jgi:hypothetical protein
MARYIEANDLVRKMTLQANRSSLGEIAPPQLSYSEMLEIIADVPTADVAPKSEVARCKDCVYFQPDFVLTNNGERRPYTEEERNSSLGMVTCDVGINCGSRCQRFDYWDDNRFPVWFQENDYCSYFKKKYTGEQT